MRAVRFVVAGLIWALTWILPLTFMIMMSWACESDARRFGQRVITRYGDEGDDIAIAMATADRKAGDNRALSVARGALVLLSLAIPLAFIAGAVANGRARSASTSQTRSAHSSPSRWSSGSASPPCEADRHRHRRVRRHTTSGYRDPGLSGHETTASQRQTGSLHVTASSI